MPFFLEGSDYSWKQKNRRLGRELTVPTGVEGSKGKATECQLPQLVPLTMQLLQATEGAKIQISQLIVTQIHVSDVFVSLQTVNNHGFQVVHP